jgi:hypothetical protein
MRGALDALFAHIPDEQAIAALRSQAGLSTLRSRLAPLLTAPVPEGERGDNLLRALIALRLKFPLDEARARLEKNLALRGARRP